MNHDSKPFDLLIRNANIIDGTGAPRFRGDVAVKGDAIVAMSEHVEGSATETIDAEGKILAPGFIDLLGHSERAVLKNSTLETKVRQGVTTEITGEGTTAAPINDKIAADRAELQPNEPADNWRTMSDFMREIEKRGTVYNFGLLVTTSNARLMTIGRVNRAATPEELETMKQIVDEAMRDGAFGLSTALIYSPASYASTEEIIELAKVAHKHGGVYFTHMRNESDRIESALDETFRIGRDSGIPLNIWHLKIGGKHNWGKMPAIIARIEGARSEGLDVAANVYPYIASKTELTALMPDWALEGGYGELLKRLEDDATRARIAAEVENSAFYGRVGGGEGVLITDLPNPEHDKYQKKRLSEVAKMMNTTPVDALITILRASRFTGGAMYFTMNEDDVQYALKQPWVSIGADSGAFSGDLATEGAHPRAYGTFPRVLGHYVRDVRLFSLEEAVRKVTSQAASRAHIWDRGVIRPGMKADLVLFDADRIADRSTYEDSHHMSVGVTDVFVNGVAILRNEQLTGKLPGRVLRHGQ